MYLPQVWFQNRRAKCRKQHRNSAKQSHQSPPGVKTDRCNASNRYRKVNTRHTTRNIKETSSTYQEFPPAFSHTGYRHESRSGEFTTPWSSADDNFKSFFHQIPPTHRDQNTKTLSNLAQTGCFPLMFPSGRVERSGIAQGLFPYNPFAPRTSPTYDQTALSRYILNSNAMRLDHFRNTYFPDFFFTSNNKHFGSELDKE